MEHEHRLIRAEQYRVGPAAVRAAGRRRVDEGEHSDRDANDDAAKRAGGHETSFGGIAPRRTASTCPLAETTPLPLKSEMQLVPLPRGVHTRADEMSDHPGVA